MLRPDGRIHIQCCQLIGTDTFFQAVAQGLAAHGKGIFDDIFQQRHILAGVREFIPGVSAGQSRNPL